MAQHRRRKTVGYFRTERGSILVLTLLLIGVLAISIAAMLSSVRHLARSADDKIAEEECYQIALAGLNTTKAWLMDGNLARAQIRDNNIAGALEQVTSGALDCSKYIVDNPKATITDSMLEQFYTSRTLSLGRTLDGGRRVVFEWKPSGSTSPRPIVIRRGDADFGTPSDHLFNTTLGRDARGWVEAIKITTPYRAEGSSAAGSYGADDLKYTSLIVEVEARVGGAGIEKSRILSGKILAIPQDVKVPPAQSGAAIVTGAGVTVKGNSSLNVHWGPVWTQGDLELLGISMSDKTVNLAANKYTGVGTNGEKWVKWATTGLITDTKGDPIFSDKNGMLNGVLVNDFFVQVLAGDFAKLTGADASKNITKDNLILSGFNPSKITDTTQYYDPLIGAMRTGPAYYDYELNPETHQPILDPVTHQPIIVPESGTFVQKSKYADAQVSASLNSLDYTTWKNFAIANNGYVRPTVSGSKVTGYVNSAGSPLYVNTAQRTLTTVSSGTNVVPLTSIGQLSMINLIPSNKNTAAIPDRILFVDTPEGRENGTMRDITINASDSFFWKGLLFIAGNLDTSGAGSFPTVFAKNPDNYLKDPPDPKNPAFLGDGQELDRVMVDGILRVLGTGSRTGNAKIYGSYAIGTNNQGSFDGSGSPDVYYNTRCKDGLFRSPRDPIIKGFIGGPIVELNAYL